MSTVSQIISAWNTNVFEHENIVSYTPKIYAYDVIEEESQCEVDKLMLDGHINAVIFLTNRSNATPIGTGAFEYRYEVIVRYYREHDLPGDNQASVRAFFEALDTRVRVGLDYNWDGSVSFQDGNESIVTVQQLNVENRNTWLGEAIYNARKRVLL